MRWYSTSQVSYFCKLIIQKVNSGCFSDLSMDPIYIMESLICFLLVFMAILEEYPGAVIINTVIINLYVQSVSMISVSKIHYVFKAYFNGIGIYDTFLAIFK